MEKAIQLTYHIGKEKDEKKIAEVIEELDDLINPSNFYLKYTDILRELPLDWDKFMASGYGNIVKKHAGDPRKNNIRWRDIPRILEIYFINFSKMKLDPYFDTYISGALDTFSTAVRDAVRDQGYYY